jgi:hypothetical protein
MLRCSKKARHSITSSAMARSDDGHGEAEHRGGLGVDDQLELARLHNWQVGGLSALEDAPSIGAGLAPRIRNVGSVAHQPAGFGKVACGMMLGSRSASPGGPIGYAGC